LVILAKREKFQPAGGVEPCDKALLPNLDDKFYFYPRQRTWTQQLLALPATGDQEGCHDTTLSRAILGIGVLTAFSFPPHCLI